MFDIDFYHNYPWASLIGVGNTHRDRFVQSHDVSCEHAQSLKKTEVEELLPGPPAVSQQLGIKAKSCPFQIFSYVNKKICAEGLDVAANRFKSESDGNLMMETWKKLGP